ISAVRYDVTMKDWLGRFKYRGEEGLQRIVAGMFISLFHQFLKMHAWRSKDIILVTYVPLSSQRLEERGFNQAEMFARALGLAFRLPVVPVLERSLHTGKQSFKTRGQRIHDLYGVFNLNQTELDHIRVDNPTRSKR